MAGINTKISKLLLEADTDAVAGDVFLSRSTPELAKKLGTIVGIIELFELSDETIEKLFDIISDLKTEYYLPPHEIDNGIEKRFEECLQRANRRIYRLLQESTEKINIKNINIFVALIFGSRIFMSQIGQSNAFLFHRKKKHDYIIIDIFNQAGERRSKLNLEKMFSNIINGAITTKDNLMICNDAVLEYLSQSELSEIVSGNNSQTAVQEIKEILESEAKNDNFYSIIIQPEADEEAMIEKSSSIVAASSQSGVPTQTSIKNLITTQEKTEQYLTPSLMPNWKKVLVLAWSGIKIIIVVIFKYSRIISLFLYQSLKQLIINFKNRAPEAVKSTKQVGHDIISEPRAFAKKTWENINRPSEGKTIKLEYRAEFSSKPGDSVSRKISNWLNRQTAKLVALNRFYQILIVVAFITAFLFCQNIVWQGIAGNAVKTSDAQELQQQIEEYINTAEAQNIFNDEAGAKNSIARAQELLGQIPDKKKNQGLRDELQQKIDNLNLTLQKISYLDNPTIIADLRNKNATAQTNGIIKIKGNIFTYDNQNQTLYTVDLEQKQTLSAQLNNDINNVKKLSAIDENSLIILNNNDFYRYNLVDNSVEQVLVAGSEIKDFDTYENKIYSLQREKNQIIRHTATSVGFNTGSSWISDGTDMSGATSLAIDGGIYVVGAGKIDYLVKGARQETNFSDINPSLGSPTQIYSEIDSNYLYILDPQNQRVVVFEKNGNLKIQYTSKEIGQFKSMIVDEADKKIYLLADNKIYLIEIGF